MTETSNDEQRRSDLEMLNRAFASFNEVTQQLQNSYDKLEKRVQELNLELANKNKELEHNLQEKEKVKNYLNNILESLTSGVIVVDQEFQVTTYNPAAEHLTGHSMSSAPGRYLGSLFDTDVFEHLIQEIQSEEAGPFTVDREWLRPSGETFNFRISASPVMEQSGARIGTVLVLQDLTQVKRLEEEAARNQRLVAMGEMAAGIAHEIRNPLGSIELCGSLLKKDLQEDEDKLPLVENICSSVSNMDRIISSLLMFAKSPQPSRQKCDLNALMEELLEFSANLVIPEEIRIQSNFEAGPMIGIGDHDLLKQVFLNLIRNGIQAMPNGGELNLSTKRAVQDPDFSNAEKEPRHYIAATVSDTGEGMHPEKLRKIFHPFYTTKDKGTGLGLAIAHNIIKAHQGMIDVDSQPGKGTRFTVKIPCWNEVLDEESR